MSKPQPPQQKSVTQTLPFWIYVFAAAGLAALLIMGPRFRERQSQIERNYQGRVRANQRAAGEELTGVLSTPDATIITLAPLYVLLVAVLLGAWYFMWRHFARNAAIKKAHAAEVAAHGGSEVDAGSLPPPGETP